MNLLPLVTQYNVKGNAVVAAEEGGLRCFISTISLLPKPEKTLVFSMYFCLRHESHGDTDTIKNRKNDKAEIQAIQNGGRPAFSREEKADIWYDIPGIGEPIVVKQVAHVI